MKRLLVVVIAALVLIACGPSLPPITSGKVVNREFVPAHYEGGWDEDCGMEYDFFNEEWDYECDSRWDPHDHWVGDRWKLQLENCEAEKCRKAWVYVDETTFHRFNVGNNYPVPG